MWLTLLDILFLNLAWNRVLSETLTLTLNQIMKYLRWNFRILLPCNILELSSIMQIITNLVSCCTFPDSRKTALSNDRFKLEVIVVLRGEWLLIVRPWLCHYWVILNKPLKIGYFWWIGLNIFSMEIYHCRGGFDSLSSTEQFRDHLNRSFCSRTF